MGFSSDLRLYMRLFPALKLVTTTIPLTFFDLFTDIFTVKLYAESAAAAVQTTAAILGIH